ncbi:MAG: L-threonylcarbamoyladenylate synthase [Candidatus Caldatribacteriota bacterium]|nr:L-threonylcarbamoyladenylate synthase [Atribacterota bacterium]MDD3640284.1 L-threonylcarbamoyladenylate synthase [Atribacterota bacterium]MDD4288457.1 L-threonylcarbamoyladenylate synthase [Atribacterota bacterium]MDI9597804.1 L-threonylcarbamoyladenylate synthase [Atribacterota bacterium]
MIKINTKIIKIETNNIDREKIREAGQAIRDGKIVAFPTETVYGLGADALNEYAIRKIFLAKNRPLYDPLIVHISCLDEIFGLVKEVPAIAIDLAHNFWPGPLTMVLKKSSKISSMVTAGLETVAIRVPSHLVALALIQESKRPIVAPSANLFAHVSPTDANHVIDDLKGKVDIIIDSGRTSVGLESTVIDVTELPLKVLRLGGITIENIKRVTSEITIGNKKDNTIKSPGMMKKHYSPKAFLILSEGRNNTMVSNILSIAKKYKKMGNKVGIIATGENSDKYVGYTVGVIGNANDLEICAQNLYSQMRLLDKQNCDIIITENFQEKGIGSAIMDRLRRAAN